MRQSIRGYADGVIEQSKTTEVVTAAAELAAVKRLFESSDDLRWAVEDPGVPVASRRGVVTDLLSSRIAKTTMRPIVFAIDHDRATGFLDDLDWLVTRFEGAAASRALTSEIVLGHKSAEERVGGYASALIEGVGPRILSRVEDELYAFERIVDTNEQLHQVLTDRDVSAEARLGLVTQLLRSKAHAVTVALAAYATQVGRPRDYPEILEFLSGYIAAESNRLLADVRSAVEMSDTQRKNLGGALSHLVGHDVEVRVIVDPTVLAGFVATIGDTIVDGTARHRLELLKDRLVLPEVKVTTGEPTNG